jgi:O-succinylbenzoate synthase
MLVYNPQSGGWGDAAPLPGFSKETFEDVCAEAQAGQLEGSRLPSVLFAVECANNPWSSGGQSVQVNALWIAEMETAEDLLIRLRDWEAPCIKVKPGSDPNPEDWGKVLRARPDARLRIDPNRGWTPEQLEAFTCSLPLDRLDYVEEPFAEAELYRALPADYPIPLAVDEQTREPGGLALAELAVIKALVLKPTLIGNAADRQPWLDLAVRRGIPVTWSSSFESGVGLWQIAALASGQGAAGLDTGQGFQHDLLDPRPIPRKGRLHLPALVSPKVGAKIRSQDKQNRYKMKKRRSG